MADNISKEQILQEVYELNEEAYDISKFVIINDAARILNGISLSPTYSTDCEDNNIDIWVDPKYYDYLVKYEEKCEAIDKDPCIWVAYRYLKDIDGCIKLHRGTKKKPKYMKFKGINVQIFDSKSNITPASKLVKFRVPK